MTLSEWLRAGALWLERNPDKWGKKRLWLRKPGPEHNYPPHSNQVKFACAMGACIIAAGDKFNQGSMTSVLLQEYNDEKAKSVHDVIAYMRQQADELESC